MGARFSVNVRKVISDDLSITASLTNFSLGKPQGSAVKIGYNIQNIASREYSKHS